MLEEANRRTWMNGERQGRALEGQTPDLDSCGSPPSATHARCRDSTMSERAVIEGGCREGRVPRRRMRQAAWLLSACVLLTGCNACPRDGKNVQALQATDGPNGPNDAVDGTDASSNPLASQPTYKDEAYGDPETFKEPRLQFVWEAPGEGRSSIWSMKLDGTDLRRAVGPKLLDSGGVTDILSDTPVRSPNGRYIVCVGVTEEDFNTGILVDLEKKALTHMAPWVSRPHFSWTPDSRQAIFYQGSKLVAFDVARKEFLKLPMIYSQGLRLTADGKTFVAIRQNAIEYYARSAKMMRRIPLSIEVNSSFSYAISPDGSFVLVHDRQGKSVFVSRDAKEHEFRRGLVERALATFSPDGTALYFLQASTREWALVLHDIHSGREQLVRPLGEILPENLPHGLSILSIRSQ